MTARLASKSHGHSKNPIHISIILSAFKRPDLLQHALSAIASQDFPSEKWELIVIDDASLEANRMTVESFRKKIKNLIFLSPGHQGSAKARMNGFAVARGEVLAFTDEDTIPQKDWLTEISKAFQKHSRAVGIEGFVHTDAQRALFSNAPSNQSGGIYLGCNTHYRKAIIDRVGGYDPDYYFWREDTGLAFKALTQGEIVFVPEVKMYHPAKTISSFSILRNLRLAKDDFILLRHFPMKTIGFLKNEWMKNFLGSLLAFGGIALIGAALETQQPLYQAIGIGAYPIARAIISLRGKQFSLQEGIEFLLFSWAKDILYPLYFVSYALQVLVLGIPPQNKPRTSQ